MKKILGGFVLAMAITFVSGADEPTDVMALYKPENMRWKAGPDSLPAGAQVTLLEGDPAKEGPYTMRLKLPDGYRVPPHTHPKTERVTVIAGTFHIGMGEKFDAEATSALPAGSHGYWSANMKHYAWAEGDTIIQLHGIGPWSIVYVNPADDPRNQGKQ
jgi:quercetin dioxygenase-like cupin family protein